MSLINATVHTTTPPTTSMKDGVEGQEEDPAPETRENQHRSLISALLSKQEDRTPSPLVVEQVPAEAIPQEKSSKEAPQDIAEAATTTSIAPASTTPSPEEAPPPPQKKAPPQKATPTLTGEPPSLAEQSPGGAGSQSGVAVASIPVASLPSTSIAASTKKKLAAPSPVKPKKIVIPRQNIDSTSRRAMALQHQWEDMFRRLMLYKAQHGDCLVPNRYSNDRQLGAWVSTQRRNFGKGVLAAARKARLDAMGFVWKTSDPRATPWMQRYDELVEFYKSFGHSIVPILFDANRPLANWVSCQRQEYRYFVEDKPSRMTAERIKLLNKVDFVWDALRHRAPAVAPKVVNMDEMGRSPSEEREEAGERKERTANKKQKQEEQHAFQQQGRSYGNAKSRAIEAHREAVEAQRKAVEAQRRAEQAQRYLEKEEAAEAAAKNGGSSILIHCGEDSDQHGGSNSQSNAHAMWAGASAMDEAARIHTASLHHAHLLSGGMNLATMPTAARFAHTNRPEAQATPQAALSSDPNQQDDAKTSSRQKKKKKRDQPDDDQEEEEEYAPQAYAEQSPPFAPTPVTSTVIAVPSPKQSFSQEGPTTTEPTAIYVPYGAYNAQHQLQQEQAALMMSHRNQHLAAAAAAGAAGHPLPNPHLMTAAAAVAAEQTRHQEHLLRAQHQHATLMNSAMAQHAQHQQQHFNMAVARNVMLQQQQQGAAAAAGLGQLDHATLLRLQQGGSLPR